MNNERENPKKTRKKREKKGDEYYNSRWIGWVAGFYDYERKVSRQSRLEFIKWMVGSHRLYYA